MVNTARDGKKFTTVERNAYHVGYGAGKWRREHGEFMGSAVRTGYRGRLRLIFNEGLEDGYSDAIELETTENTKLPVGWRVNDFPTWSGEGVRICYIWGRGKKAKASISNMNMPFCGSINAIVPIGELQPYK